MTKEERAEKWFQSVPETEAIPIQTKMEICSQAAKRMAFIWLVLLGVECLSLFWVTRGELFNQVADFLNQLAEVSPTKNRYKGLALVGALICLPVLIFPGIAAAKTVPPVSTKSKRKPVTASSRQMITATTQAGAISRPTSMIKADITNSLSAIGSANFPKLLTTCHFLAK